MDKVPRLSVTDNVDTEAQCLYRYVYGADDIFNPHSHTFYEIFNYIRNCYAPDKRHYAKTA